MAIRGCLKSGVLGQTAQHQADSLRSVPMPHCLSAAPRNPGSTAAADLATRRFVPPPSAGAAPQNHTAPPCTTQSPTDTQPLLNPLRQSTTISAVSPNQPQPGEPPRQSLQHQSGAAPIRHIRRMHRHRQQQSRCVHHNMALAPHHFLAGVVTAILLFSVVFTV